MTLHHRIRSCVLMIITILIGMSFALMISRINLDLSAYFHDDVALNFKEIIIHNSPFLLLFSTPIIGWFYYAFTLLYSFVAIGLSIAARGFVATISKLIHMPLELYAFSSAILLSRCFFRETNYKKLIKEQIINMMILILAAGVESCL